MAAVFPCNLVVERINNVSQFNDYFKLKCDQNAILWSGFEAAPNENVMRDYFMRLINSDKIGLLFKFDGEVIGYCQLSQDNNYFEVDGYSVLTPYSGRGFGKEIIRLISSPLNYHLPQKSKMGGGGNCLGINK